MRNGCVRVTAKEKWKVSVKASSCDMSATPETVSMSQELSPKHGTVKHGQGVSSSTELPISEKKK